MSATVSDLAAALSSALETITGLRTAAYLTDTVSPPVALVAIETIDYHGAFGGGDVVHEFTVYLIVGRASDRAALEAIEGYMSQDGDTSIRAAVEFDPTLGGIASGLKVTKSGPATSLSVNGTPTYISVPFTVEVHA